MFDRPFSDYVYFSERSSQGYEPPPLTFGTVREVREETGCSLCRLVWKAFILYGDGLEPPEKADGRQLSITVESVAVGHYGPIETYGVASNKNEDPELFAIRLYFGFSSSVWKNDSATDDWRAVIHRVDESKAVPNKLCCGRQIGDQGPEGPVMWNWLQLCQEQHPLCTNDDPSFEYPNRLIDIRRECLVEKSDILGRPKYAILSYVWGNDLFITLNSSTSALLRKPGIISISNSEIPATIRDTIRVCQILNQEYLWVDALCIKQDGLAEKMAEIGRMDDIYGGAELTIVAASGDRARAGLPGIGHTLRVNTQHLLEIDGFVLANRLPSAEKLVDMSFWNSRAWTYQERLFSRRLLIFTDTQVFFKCRQMQCCEDTVSEHTVPQIESSFEAVGLSDDDQKKYLVLKTLSPLEFPYDDMTEFQKYAHFVKEYSKRSLSFESDVFNAFRGVMSQLGFQVLKSETQYNLPLRLIDIAILWRPSGTLRKRNILSSEGVIPSWSWAWWVGPVEYVEQLNLAERTLSQRVEQFARSACKMPPSNPAHWIEKDDILDGASKIRGYTRQIVDGEVWYSTNVRYTMKFDTSGLLCRPANNYHQRDFDREPFNGILTLTTSVAEFFISKQHVDDITPVYSHAIECTANTHQVCHLVITDSNGARAGCVVVDGNTANSLQPGMFSFVKLSRTTLTHDDNDPAWEVEAKAFAGVPGEPAINPDFEETSTGEMWFDDEVFDSSICWCLYNVMMVKWREDGVGLRIEIGKIHLHALDAAAGDERHVNLG